MNRRTDILVSIVTGTYNRIEYLKGMVNSARKSMGIGFPYEIIIVDGGSKDGTIEWCKKQEDVVLLEQGRLLGAVKAFNAGFQECVGEYVIIANDDIEFLSESIVGAVAFMIDHNSTGIGCFCQDRGGREFHVEHMPAVKDGRPVSVPYGQVCIVPRELGNKVGWWGTEYHTYAGDNELSCNVYELGYKIEVMEPCCCVHDYVTKDDLRLKNMGSVENHPSTGHPDSNKWVSKWTRNGLLGPRIPNTFSVRKEKKISRVLYAPIYDPSVNTKLQIETKFGLREALEKEFHVAEVDYYSNPLKLIDVAEYWKPDIFLTQIQDAKVLNLNHIKYLQSYHKNAIYINWNGDFHPEHILDPEYMNMMSLFDISLYVTTFMRKEYDKAKLNWKYWQIGYEISKNISDETPKKDTPKHDVLLLGNGYHAERVKLGEFLRGMKNINVGMYGFWPKHIRTNGMNIYDFAAGARLYKNCKIAISDSRKEAPGFVSNRLFQALYSGAFLLQQRVEGIEELTGLKSGVHFVEWTDLKDLKDKINWYLLNIIERNRISKAGQKEVLKNHSFDARVEELKVMMQKENLRYYSKSGE
jgi:glycosyltransferase involved in cell wall biosynthesis